MRALGPTETSVWFVDQVCSLNFCMVAHLSDRADAHRLQDAMNATIRRHPLLRATIRTAPELHFESTAETFELTEFSGQWQPRALHHINARFEPGVPLARYELVRDAAGDVLLVCFHHCIGDGISGANLLRDLLAAYNGRSLASTSQIPAPLDTLRPATARGMRGFLTLLRFILWSGWQMLRHCGTPQTPRLEAPAEAPRSAHFVHIAFDTDHTSAIQQRAKTLHCTVHGVIGAALAEAMRSESIHAYGTPILSFGSAVNLRKQLVAPPHDELGLYVSIANALTPNATSTNFGDTARAISLQVRSQMDNGSALALISMLARLFVQRWLFRPTAQGIERARRLALAVFSTGTTGLTNLGVLTLTAPDDALRATRAHFVVSPSVMGLIVATAATTNGQLTLNLCCMEPQIGRERAEKIATDLQTALSS